MGWNHHLDKLSTLHGTFQRKEKMTGIFVWDPMDSLHHRLDVVRKLSWPNGCSDLKNGKGILLLEL